MKEFTIDKEYLNKKLIDIQIPSSHNTYLFGNQIDIGKHDDQERMIEMYEKFYNTFGWGCVEIDINNYNKNIFTVGHVGGSNNVSNCNFEITDKLNFSRLLNGLKYIGNKITINSNLRPIMILSIDFKNKELLNDENYDKFIEILNCLDEGDNRLLREKYNNHMTLSELFNEKTTFIIKSNSKKDIHGIRPVENKKILINYIKKGDNLEIVNNTLSTNEYTRKCLSIPSSLFKVSKDTEKEYEHILSGGGLYEKIFGITPEERKERLKRVNYISKKILVRVYPEPLRISAQTQSTNYNHVPILENVQMVALNIQLEEIINDKLKKTFYDIHTAENLLLDYIANKEDKDINEFIENNKKIWQYCILYKRHYIKNFVRVPKVYNKLKYKIDKTLIEEDDIILIKDRKN